MAKVDYTKTEQLLQEGLLKMSITHLLHLADISTSIGTPNQLRISEETAAALRKLERDLHSIKSKDPELYEKLDLTEENFNHLFHEPGALKPKDWQQLRILFNRAKELKEEIKNKQSVQQTDDDIIEMQRKKQKTKRFNINDKWIPLQ